MASLTLKNRVALACIGDGRTYVLPMQRQTHLRQRLRALSQIGLVIESEGSYVDRSYTITEAGRAVLASNLSR